MTLTPCLPDAAAALDALAAQLTAVGWGTLALDPLHPLLAQAQEEAGGHALAGRLAPATTGRAIGRTPGGLRGDSTLWLDDAACGLAARGLLGVFDTLRTQLNRRLTLGLREVEAHFARYPAGSGYARHRDRFSSDDARVLSLVLYLNAGWPVDGGGDLRLHLASGPTDIAPRLGTLVVFLSADIEHEVLPATWPRLSVAAWFRQRPRAA